MRTAAFFLAILSVFSSAYAGDIGHEFLPPEHWCYDALERFEALGFVVLPSQRPFTRPDVITYVETIRDMY